MSTNDLKKDEEFKSNWDITVDLTGGAVPCRVEGETGDLVVLGQIPREIDGTFYRLMIDPYYPPCEGYVPLDGDGLLSAFRFHEGRVDMKTRYVETERYKLERQAGKALFGLYRNPYTHHPCVRAAIDSTANTNIVLWADKLLALKEGGLPYAMDPNTLETLGYDPFGQVKAKTFTAHPKYDPYKDELVVYGYEASGLASTDVVSYTIDHSGKIHNEFWFKQPFDKPGMIHDCSFTSNWLILYIWPFEANMERMKAGGRHWSWAYDRKATFLVAPRNQENPPLGWKAGEVRHYEWQNAMLIHTGAAWEDADGNILTESSRVYDNAFPFFPSDDGRMPAPDTKADFVRWKIDPRKPAGSQLEDPQVIMDAPAEFPRVDERFLSKPCKFSFLNAFMPGKSDGMDLLAGFNAVVMVNSESGEKDWFYAGESSFVQEPIFVPRSDEEGDGWVIALIERIKTSRCELVVLDTKNFSEPVAWVQLPFRMKAQVHGNWVAANRLGGHQPLVREIHDFDYTRGKSALDAGEIKTPLRRRQQQVLTGQCDRLKSDSHYFDGIVERSTVTDDLESVKTAMRAVPDQIDEIATQVDVFTYQVWSVLKKWAKCDLNRTIAFTDEVRAVPIPTLATVCAARIALLKEQRKAVIQVKEAELEGQHLAGRLREISESSSWFATQEEV